MRAGIFAGVVLSLTFTLAAATTALADDDAQQGPRGIELGLRSGISLPLGDSSSGNSLKDSLTTRIPIWVDAGYRISPRFYVGAMVQYGVISVADSVSTACSLSGADCLAYDLQAGLMGAFHILPDAKFDPWVGLGIGYEWATIHGGAPNGSNITLSGLQFVNLQLVADYKPTPNFGFSSALHEWLTFGLRGVYDISL